MDALSPDQSPLRGSLRRPQLCAFALAGLTLLLTAATLMHFAVLASLPPQISAVFFRALSLSTLLSLVPLSVIWFLDRRERETPWLLAATFLWGGLIATAISAPFNTVFFRYMEDFVELNPVLIDVLGPDASTLLAAPISAPVVEEIAKALGVLLVFWLLRDEFDNVRDGFVYGALIGIGFNWFETALHVAQGYAKFGVAPYGLQIGGRYALFGLGGHAMFTGIFGAFLGVAMQTRSTLLRIVSPLVGLVLAIAAHALNNVLPILAVIAGAADERPPSAQIDVAREVGFLDAFLAGSWIQLTLFAPFVLIVALMLWRSGLWERRVIEEELADEIGRAVTAREYDEIRRDGIFRTRRIDELHPYASAALVNAQHELAFRKRKLRHYGANPERDPLVARWRDLIRHLRAAV